MSAFSRANDRLWDWTISSHRLLTNALRLLLLILIADTVVIGIIGLALWVAGLAPAEFVVGMLVGGYFASAAGMAAQFLLDTLARGNTAAFLLNVVRRTPWIVKLCFLANFIPALVNIAVGGYSWALVGLVASALFCLVAVYEFRIDVLEDENRRLLHGSWLR